MRNAYLSITPVLLALLSLLAFGCADQPRNGPTAESLYKQARAIEDRPAPDVNESHRNLLAARQLYTEALSKNPPPILEAYIRAGLGFDAYNLEDYSTAVEQYATAYPHLQDAEQKSWTLLRIGVAQQRLGRFDQADATLARVLREYPDTVPAKQAREKIGVRQFYLQLAAFNSASGAINALNELKQLGLNPVLGSDAQGRHHLRLGPLTSYSQAHALRARVADKYPDAMIIP